MRIVLKVVGILVALVLVVGGGGFLWAKSRVATLLDRTVETHRAEFPIPFPPTPEEMEKIVREHAAPPPAEGAAADAAPAPDPLAGLDLKQIGLELAVARGKHLVEARYVCTECHGADFGGGTMIEDPAIGSLHGPNLTVVTTKFTASDWDRAVRHGVLPTGKVSVMPSDDFKNMSDRELSDVIAYIRTKPVVQREVPPRSFGPVGTFLVALGKIKPGADYVADHQAPHQMEPPPEAPSVEYGQHLAQVCTGCHRADLSGGKILAGDPSWPPAANLTPVGLKSWKYDDFVKLLRTGTRADGTKVRQPMALMPKYAANMSETELKALWAYVQSVPPKETEK